MEAVLFFPSHLDEPHATLCLKLLTTSTSSSWKATSNASWRPLEGQWQSRNWCLKWVWCLTHSQFGSSHSLRIGMEKKSESEGSERKVRVAFNSNDHQWWLDEGLTIWRLNSINLMLSWSPPWLPESEETNWVVFQILWWGLARID